MPRLDLGAGVLGAGAERGADGGLGQQGCIPLPPSLPPPMHEGLRAPPAVACLCLWPRGVLAPLSHQPPALQPQPPALCAQCGSAVCHHSHSMSRFSVPHLCVLCPHSLIPSPRPLSCHQK